mgnify:CR=1 FL=1
MQKYSINLYIDDLKPTVYYLTLTNVIYVMLVTLVIVVGAEFYLNNLIQNKSERLELVQKQVNDAQNKLKQLQQALIKHNDKVTFSNQKEKLQKNLEGKEILWEGVGKQLRATTVDYFLVMDELTKHHDHNLWLSSFRFNEDEAIFKGYALDSSAVTNWMTYLQASKSFQGREFSYMNMKAINNNILSFQVATDASLILSEKERRDE